MNTFSNSKYDQKDISKETTKSLVFPSWKSLINKLVFDHCDENMKRSQGEVNAMLNGLFQSLEDIKAVVEKYHPSKVIEILSKIESGVVIREPVDAVRKKFESMQIGPNEFYTIYDIESCNYWVVDEKIEMVLGVEPKDFNVWAMAGLDPENRLYHTLDINHMMRWASIGYLMIALPFFTWSNSDFYYQVQFRVAVSKSSIDRFKKVPFVILDKKCYPFFELNNMGLPVATYHFDRWSVYSSGKFDFVRPLFITGSENESTINALLFLINAYLLDLPVKYLLILNERQNHDRNKAIANSMNSKMAEYAGINTNFDEFQIGDYFAKTIRERIAKIMNLWDKRQPDDLVTVDSDHLAVYYAKTLGLLPLPDNMEEMIYGQITW